MITLKEYYILMSRYYFNKFVCLILSHKWQNFKMRYHDINDKISYHDHCMRCLKSIPEIKEVN